MSPGCLHQACSSWWEPGPSWRCPHELRDRHVDSGLASSRSSNWLSYGCQHEPPYPAPSLTLRSAPPAAAPAEDVTPPFDAATVQAALRAEKPEVFEALEQARAAAAAEAAARPPPPAVAGASREELEVTFLGTGAAIPSKYRNVTSIFVNLFDRGCLLMDAGGRVGQAGGVSGQGRGGVGRPEGGLWYGWGCSCFWGCPAVLQRSLWSDCWGRGMATRWLWRSKSFRPLPHPPALPAACRAPRRRGHLQPAAAALWPRRCRRVHQAAGVHLDFSHPRRPPRGAAHPAGGAHAPAGPRLPAAAGAGAAAAAALPAGGAGRRAAKCTVPWESFSMLYSAALQRWACLCMQRSAALLAPETLCHFSAPCPAPPEPVPQPSIPPLPPLAGLRAAGADALHLPRGGGLGGAPVRC